jgi:hypothetical protein
LLLTAWCWLLAAGCWLLAVAAGFWLLAAGCWLLAAGCWLLAAGCWVACNVQLMIAKPVEEHDDWVVAAKALRAMIMSSSGAREARKVKRALKQAGRC